MSVAHVVSLLGAVAAVAGVSIGATWVWATGLTVAIMYLEVAETADETLRGLYAALGVPVVLTVAILTGS